MKINIFLVFLSLCLLSCGSESSSVESEAPESITPPNILLIITDDMGKDATPNYPEGTQKPHMPHLQNLINSGITFDNVWAYSVCSPTRAAILTGKYGYHTGVLEVEQDISLSEVSLHEYIDTQSPYDYDTALIGKWNLSNVVTDPNTMGIDYYSGILGGGVSSYTNWMNVTNGTRNNNTEYVTTQLTDTAINWINQREKPWFLWLAYNAPHTPFHLAPTELHQQGSLPIDAASIDSNPLPYYFSAIEAIDHEMGRLIESLPGGFENTLIIFLGDNGSPGAVVQTPYTRRRTKGSIYQGGINVPMIVAGNGVNHKGVREEALIHVTDIFSTIANATGVTTPNIYNSQSFYSLFSNTNDLPRTTVYTEKSSDNVISYTLRDAQFKLIVTADGSEELYDLVNDAYESTNLLNSTLTDKAAIALENLRTEAIRIRS